MGAESLARDVEALADLKSQTRVTDSAPPAARRALHFMLLVVAATAATLAGRAMSPLQEAMRIHFGLTDNELALLLGPAVTLPVLIAAIPAGFLIDRYSRVRLLLIFAIIDLAGSFLTAVATGFLTLVIARCLVGLAVLVVLLTGFSLLADLYRPEQRGRAKALLVLGQYAGTSAAFAAGGALLTMFDGEGGWRWAMFWLTVPLLVLVVLMMLVMREPLRTDVVVKNPSSRDSLLELWRYRKRVVPLMIGIVLAEMPIFAILTWAVPALTRSYELTPDRVGAIMATAMMVSGLVGPMTGGVLADFCQRTGGPRRTVTTLSGMALLSTPLTMFALAPNASSASFLLVTCITLVGATLAVGVTLLTIVVPNELRGLCFAIASVIQGSIGSVVVMVISLVSGLIGGPLMLGKALAVVCVGTGLMCSLTFALARSNFPRGAAL